MWENGVIRWIAIGDYNTLFGHEKRSKLEYLQQSGRKIHGVQIISLKSDLLPANLEKYHLKLQRLVEKFPYIERVSIAMLCWPLITTVEDGDNVDVAGNVSLNTDYGHYAVGMGLALQKLWERNKHLEVDISYHPLYPWARRSMSSVRSILGLQNLLWEQELNYVSMLTKMWKAFGVRNVKINRENEPTFSDKKANLVHMLSRTFKELTYGLPDGWGVTADVQHLMMMLTCLEQGFDVPGIWPPSKHIDVRTLEEQYAALYNVPSVTFHLSQMSNPMAHITPDIDLNYPVMRWPEHLEQIQNVANHTDTWCGVEINNGHEDPAGYNSELIALEQFQGVLN